MLMPLNDVEKTAKGMHGLGHQPTVGNRRIWKGLFETFFKREGSERMVQMHMCSPAKAVFELTTELLIKSRAKKPKKNTIPAPS